MNTCKVHVPDGGRLVSFHDCGRKLSGSDDYPELCGLHASAKRRAKQRAEAAQTQRQVSAAALAAFKDRAAGVGNTLGLPLTVQTSYPTVGPLAHTGSRPTSNVIVNLADLEALIEKMRGGL